MQNLAARLVTHTKKHAHISPILKSLHWLLVDRQIQFKILLLTFKCLYVQAPSYLTDLIQVSMPTTQLRDSSKLILKSLLLKPNYGNKWFTRAEADLLNTLPEKLQEEESRAEFKKLLKTHLFDLEFTV